MRFDAFDQFSNQQVLSGSSAAVSTNSKKKPAAQDLGVGLADMGAAIFIDQGALGGTGTDLTIELIEATDDALTTSIKSLASMTIPKASLVDGAAFFLGLPGYLMSQEYFGIRYTPVGGTITGKINVYYGSKDDVAKYKSFNTSYVVKN